MLSSYVRVNNYSPDLNRDRRAADRDGNADARFGDHPR